MSTGRRRKPLLSNEQRDQLDKSRGEQEHTCPLCGKYADPGFTRMYCVTPNCRNYDYETWCKHRSASAPTWEEDTIQWKF